jgi:hypothetical protein
MRLFGTYFGSGRGIAARARSCARAGMRGLLPSMLLLILASLLLPAGAARASTAVSGTVIRNTATVSYSIPSSGVNITNFPSNEVDVTVAQVPAFTLSSSQTRTTAPNTQVIFNHTITNTGNGPDRFVLTVQNPAPGCGGACTYTFSSAAIAPDLAPQDGIPDSPPVATITTPVLAAGQSYTFVMAAQVPASATGGQSSQAQVSAAGDPATAAAGGYSAAATATNIDTANVSSGAVINASKAYSITSGPSPSTGNVTITIT